MRRGETGWGGTPRACIPCSFPHNGAFTQLPGDFWGVWECRSTHTELSINSLGDFGDGIWETLGGMGCVGERRGGGALPAGVLFYGWGNLRCVGKIIPRPLGRRGDEEMNGDRWGGEGSFQPIPWGNSLVPTPSPFPPHPQLSTTPPQHFVARAAFNQFPGEIVRGGGRGSFQTNQVGNFKGVASPFPPHPSLATTPPQPFVARAVWKYIRIPF